MSELGFKNCTSIKVENLYIVLLDGIYSVLINGTINLNNGRSLAAKFIADMCFMLTTTFNGGFNYLC
jgi:hypothetical protein